MACFHVHLLNIRLLNILVFFYMNMLLTRYILGGGGLLLFAQFVFNDLRIFLSSCLTCVHNVIYQITHNPIARFFRVNMFQSIFMIMKQQHMIIDSNIY